MTRDPADFKNRPKTRSIPTASPIPGTTNWSSRSSTGAPTTCSARWVFRSSPSSAASSRAAARIWSRRVTIALLASSGARSSGQWRAPEIPHLPAWHLYAARIDFERAGMSRARADARAVGATASARRCTTIRVHRQPYYATRFETPVLPGAGSVTTTARLFLPPSLLRDDVRQTMQRVAESAQSISSDPLSF